MTDKIEITGAAFDTLFKLLKFGPQQPGDLPSKSGMSELIGLDFVKTPDARIYSLTDAGEKYIKDWLKNDMLDKQQEAVTAAYKWCCALPLGNERIKAFAIYENLRTATRI